MQALERNILEVLYKYEVQASQLQVFKAFSLFAAFQSVDRVTLSRLCIPS